jgi:hypothetical protein
MLPLTLLVAQKTSDLLTSQSALALEVAALGASASTIVPSIDRSQIFLSSAGPDLADSNLQFTYPRICLYSGLLRNSLVEKFRTLSGSVSLVADIWTSGAMATDTDRWIHFYVEAYTALLGKNIGDWGDGVFFSGQYEVNFQPPKLGGLGFLQTARITSFFLVSRG